MTLLDVAVIIVVCSVTMALLAVRVNAAREAARQVTCTEHMKQMGVAFQNHLSTYAFLPSSASIQVRGGARKVGGWSFLVKLLPFTEHQALYKSISLGGGPEESDAGAQAAMGTSIPEFLCPDNRHPLFRDTKADPPTGALTNYKAMGATCQQSLVMVLGTGQPPYGPASIHPDGAIFPGNGIRAADFMDGRSHTVLCVETIDDRASRWTVGCEASVAGLPNSIVAGATKGPYPYFAPKGYDGKFGSQSALSRSGVRTFLAYDFAGKDAGAYEDAKFSATAAAYGPSSGHAGFVNHLFADGRVQHIRKDVDAAAYMFIITKNGCDPFAGGAPFPDENLFAEAPAAEDRCERIFEVPGLFSIESPKVTCAWRKKLPTDDPAYLARLAKLRPGESVTILPDRKGDVYVCYVRSGPAPALVSLRLQQQDMDDDESRRTMLKVYFNDLSDFSKKTFHLGAKEPKLATPIPDKVSFDYEVRHANGKAQDGDAKDHVSCTAIFGKNTYLIWASSQSTEEAKELLEMAVKSFREIGKQTSK